VTVNWILVGTIAAPIIALFVGAALDRILERKPKVISYLGHVSAFTLTNPPGTSIYTHAIVVKNTGRRPATNVCLSHLFLPDNFNLAPSVAHQVLRRPDGSADIVLPTLVPGEQVTVSYLYFPPITWAQINSTVKHQDGFAKILTVFPTPVPAPWVVRSYLALVLLGTISLLYLIAEVAKWLWSLR